MSTELRAIRGGTGVAADTREAIHRATLTLLDALLSENGLAQADVECLWWGMTTDLRADVPPLALREAGIEIPSMCASDADFEGGPKRTIRVMALARVAEGRDVTHVFLEGASFNRPSAPDVQS